MSHPPVYLHVATAPVIWPFAGGGHLHTQSPWLDGAVFWSTHVCPADAHFAPWSRHSSYSQSAGPATANPLDGAAHVQIQSPLCDASWLGSEHTCSAAVHTPLFTSHSSTRHVAALPCACPLPISHSQIQSPVWSTDLSSSWHACPATAHTCTDPRCAHVSHRTMHSSSSHVAAASFASPVVGATHRQNHESCFSTHCCPLGHVLPCVAHLLTVGGWQSTDATGPPSFTLSFSRHWHTQLPSPPTSCCGSRHVCPASPHTLLPLSLPNQSFGASHSSSLHFADDRSPCVPVYGQSHTHTQSPIVASSGSLHVCTVSPAAFFTAAQIFWFPSFRHSSTLHVAGATICSPFFGATHRHFQSDVLPSAVFVSTHVCSA
eukprot:Rhum_TRINITY_DN14850_c4_g1::Rhum_TRINITY_DN14850_c4_g1_i1::g.122316::m.122316